MISLPALPNLHISTNPLLAVKNFVNSHLSLIKHLANISAYTVIVFAIINLGLYIICQNRVAPFARVNGQSFSLVPLDRAARQLTDKYSGAKLALNVEGRAVELRAVNVGIEISPQDTLGRLSQHSGWRRLPLLNMVSNVFSEVQPAYTIADKTLSESLKSIVTEAYKPAQDARVTIPTDPAKPIEISSESKGFNLNAQIAAQEVSKEVEKNNFAVKISPKILEPKWYAIDFAAFKPQIEAARQMSLAVNSADKKLTIDTLTLQQFLQIYTAGDKLSLTLDRQALTDYLNSHAGLFSTAAVATHINLKDGLEISRTVGTAGQTINVDKTADNIITAFSKGVPTSEAVLMTVDPTLVYSRAYSNTDAGLYKLIEDFAKTHGGTYQVAAVELKGPGTRSAFYAADDVVVPASTYKIFVAYATMLKIEQGVWALDTSTSLGSIDYCIHKMIIISDNACAETLQAKLGWKELDTFLHNQGFVKTNLNNSAGGNKKSTAREEMKLLTGIYFDELINQNSQEYLFSIMKQQAYRQGIKAGSRGSVVADKVGILDGSFHDMGIVYTPKATYALVIMTEEAGGFTNIKLLSQQIYDFYNQ